MNFKTFIFSPFQVNSYVLFDNTKECVIIDPANFFDNEHSQIDNFIEENGLTPTKIITTHNHLDHIFGAKYLTDKYNVDFMCHKDEVYWLDNFRSTCESYGISIDYDASAATSFINDGDIINFGNSKLQAVLVPGHSAGGLAFYAKNDELLFCGDILFQGSIGRTDLPGGNFEQLISGVKSKLFTLPDTTVVYPGHGLKTTIGEEKKSNPFFE